MPALCRRWLFAWLSLASGCISLAGPDLDAFIERRTTCDHWRGEFPDPPDPERAAEVDRRVVEYCTGTDAQLAALKKRYRSDREISRRLEAYEPRIEKAIK